MLDDILSKIPNSDFVRIFDQGNLLYEGYVGCIKYAHFSPGGYAVDNIRIAASVLKRQRYLHNIVPMIDDRKIAESCKTADFLFKDMEVKAFIHLDVHRLETSAEGGT